MTIHNIIDKFSKESSDNIVCIHSFSTPVGDVYCAANTEFLYIVTFADSKVFEKSFQSLSNELKCKFIEKKNTILEQTENELKDYFDGKLRKFSVPVKTFGTPFQKQVWDKLCEMPYGATQSYGDLAVILGRAPSHSRAVGAACGANCHLIVIPCHRLVASNSKGGFNSGVDRKSWLIDHEKKNSKELSSTFK